jgi:hypothetical protein
LVDDHLAGAAGQDRREDCSTPAILIVARNHHIQAHPTLARPICLESSHLPNPQAIMNDRVNRMEPEQYPPSPALSRNESPPYSRLIGTDYQKSILKVES